MRHNWLIGILFSSAVLFGQGTKTSGAAAGAQTPLKLEAGTTPTTPAHQLAHDIYKELIETNTTDSVGSTTVAAQKMAARLIAAGFPAADVKVLAPVAKRGNLVVRYRGAGKGKPVLFIAHLDVVEAKREDWSVDPFTLTEKNGYFYGRGTQDVKEGDTFLMTGLIELKKSGYVPQRDIIVALTSDEEGGNNNGIDWLLKNHKDLLMDAEYCVNPDAGDFQLENGKPLLAAISASEKTYIDYYFESRNAGGHSARPIKDNAIYHLAGALTRLQNFDFPPQLNEVTRGFFAARSKLESGSLAADMAAVSQATPDPAAEQRLSQDPYFNALLRTTCVATMLEGGHARNALPQLARANVNCRLLPGEKPDDVLAKLTQVAADPQVKVGYVDSTGSVSPASPLLPQYVGPIEGVIHDFWPGLPIVPTMDVGASDGRYLRAQGMPVYGVPGAFIDKNDNRAHGRNERLEGKWFYAGVDFYTKLMHDLSSK